MAKPHPRIGDDAMIRFAGSQRTGKIVEIKGTGKDKRWTVRSKGVYYPCLTLDKTKMNHIINYIPVKT
jgi:hypothetical protein